MNGLTATHPFWTYRRVLYTPLIIGSVTLILLIVLIVWNLSLVSNVRAFNESEQTVSSLKAEIITLQTECDRLAEQLVVDRTLTTLDLVKTTVENHRLSLQTMTQGVTTIDGEERSYLRLTLVGYYKPLVKALRDIERHPNLFVSRASVTGYPDDPDKVSLSVTLVERGR